MWQSALITTGTYGLKEVFPDAKRLFREQDIREKVARVRHPYTQRAGAAGSTNGSGIHDVSSKVRRETLFKCGRVGKVVGLCRPTKGCFVFSGYSSFD